MPFNSYVYSECELQEAFCSSCTTELLLTRNGSSLKITGRVPGGRVSAPAQVTRLKSALCQERHLNLSPHPKVINLRSAARRASTSRFHISLSFLCALAPVRRCAMGRGCAARRGSYVRTVGRCAEWRWQLRSWKRTLLMGRVRGCEAPDLEATWGARIPPVNGPHGDSASCARQRPRSWHRWEKTPGEGERGEEFVLQPGRESPLRATRRRHRSMGTLCCPGKDSFLRITCWRVWPRGSCSPSSRRHRGKLGSSPRTEPAMWRTPTSESRAASCRTSSPLWWI